MDRCSNFDCLSVDTEGFTAEGKLGVSIATPLLDAMYFPYNHKENVNIDDEVRAIIDSTLENVSYRIFHNAGHDITILPNLANKPFICTMIMGHMLNENLMSKSLDYMAKYYLGEEKVDDPLMESIKKHQGWEWIPFSLMNKYAMQDAKLPMKLLFKFLPWWEEEYGSVWSTF